jgi:hypothetical protein
MQLVPLRRVRSHQHPRGAVGGVRALARSARRAMVGLAKTPIDDGQYGPRNQSDTTRE